MKELEFKTEPLKGDLLEDKNKVDFISYRPEKSDPIDVLLATTVNDLRISLPIEREEQGRYIFGTKKVQVKSVGEKVVIRVGGGWMSVDEFVQTYGMQEMHSVLHHTTNAEHGHEHEKKGIHFHIKQSLKS